MFEKLLKTNHIKVLSHRDFRLIWLAGVASTAGSILHDVALLWLVAEDTGSALAVGSVVISGALPFMVFGLIGGAFADRFDRRRIMLAADLLRAVIVLMIPILFHFDLLTLPAILILNFLRTSAGRFFYPAQQAMIPATVPPDLLADANATSQSANMLVAAATPVLSGILIAVVGTVSVFYFDVATFLLSAGFLFFLSKSLHTIRSDNTEKKPGMFDDIKGGIAYVFQTPVLRILAIVSMINIFAFGPYRPVAILFFQEDVMMTAEQFGLNLSLAFVGLAIGSASGGRVVRVLQPGSTYILGLVVMGVATLAIASFSLIEAIYGLSFIRAFGNGLIVIAYTTLLQSQADDSQRGRVFGTMGVISETGRPIAVGLGAGLADVFGTRLTIAIGGAIFLVAGGFALTGRRMLDEAKAVPSGEESPA